MDYLHTVPAFIMAEEGKLKFTPERDLFLLRTENPYIGTSSWNRVFQVLIEGGLRACKRTAKDRTMGLLRKFKAQDVNARFY